MLPFASLLGKGNYKAAPIFKGATIGTQSRPTTALSAVGGQVGDYAIWCNTPPPTSGWVQITNGVYAKKLVAADLNATVVASRNWCVSIYSTVGSVAVVSPSGFTRAPNHLGVFAVAFNGFTAGYATLTSPPNAVYRVATPTATNGTILNAWDFVPPNAAYTDGAPFTPNTTSFVAVELRA